ncbi:MAG TPA: GldM family protein [Bacteroidales bacterium]|nr:GldM family protein [Bacteroidales bacterium]
MKTKQSFLVILLFLCFFGFSQEQSNKVAVEFMQLENVIYKGIENTVTISASGYSSEDLSFKINNGTIEKTEISGKMIIKTDASVGSTLELHILAKGTEIRVVEYIVNSVPDPLWLLGSYQSGSYVPISDILNTPIKAIKDPHFFYEANYSVKSFCIIIPVKGGVPQKYEINGQKIADNPAAANAARNSFHQGDIISFSDFTIYTPSGLKENVPGVAFIVRE